MIDSRRDEPITQDVLPDGSVDPVYQARAELLNDAIQRIGMGKYQVSLILCLAALNLSAPVASVYCSRLRMARRHFVDRRCRCNIGTSRPRVPNSGAVFDLGYEPWFIGRGDGLECR